MTPERWQDVESVLHAVLELEPEERTAYLDRACASDHSLRREVETLLASGDLVCSSFLQSPPVAGSLEFQGSSDEHLQAAKSVESLGREAECNAGAGRQLAVQTKLAPKGVNVGPRQSE